VREYDLFLPLNYNDGTPIAPSVIPTLRVRLLEQFHGVTYFPQPSEGHWQMAGVTYRDEIVIFRVVASNVRVARRFFRQLKAELKRDLRQEEILIIERDVRTL
jgi:Iap family predicted aminopeptidase